MYKYFVVTYIIDNPDDMWYSSSYKEDFVDKSAALQFAEHISKDLYVHDVEVFTGKVEGGRIIPDAALYVGGGEDK